MKALVALALAAVCLSFTHLDAFQFRSTSDVVRVYTTVQDTTGRLVSDLKQEDFVITDNGKEQPITLFSNEIEPFSVVMILDRSGSMYQHQYVIRDAAMSFIVRLLSDDKARIASFGDTFGNRVVISPPNFTSNKADLIDTLQVPIGIGGASPVYIAIDQSITALSNVTDRERRVVLIFSDGRDEPMSSLVPVKLKDLIDRARTTKVMIYALAFTDVDKRTGKSPRITPPDPGLRKLTDDSGGGYFDVTDTAKLSEYFSQVAEDLHRQYLLGFSPPARDGKIHKITVKVNKGGMTARARQTYVAPGG